MRVDEFPRIETPRTILAMPGAESASDVLLFELENAEHFSAWDPALPADYYTEHFLRRQLEENRSDFLAERAVRFFLFEKKRGERSVIGYCNFNHIERAARQSCRLAFGLDYRRQGRGLMTEALREAIRYIFNRLGLHRIEASYMPTNEASGRLLKRLGFAVEGYSRDLIFINGQWKDHLQAALLNSVAPIEHRS